MFVEPIKCDNCGREGRPGSLFRFTGDASGGVAHCVCGKTFQPANIKDQCILSDNIFTRLAALSNHHQYGSLEVAAGGVASVSFQRPFDFACRAFLTPMGRTLVLAREVLLEKSGMKVIAGRLPGGEGYGEPVTVNWSVYGLVDIDQMPGWRTLFYGAVTQLANGLWKPAIIEYAVSFEAFLEAFLRKRLEAQFGLQVTDHILDKSWRVEERCKEILKLATGKRMTDRSDVYQAWDNFVRGPRNRLAHGDLFAIDGIAAEKAHQATYDAMKWLESL